LYYLHRVLEQLEFCKEICANYPWTLSEEMSMPFTADCQTVSEDYAEQSHAWVQYC
jgi:hypothetical protein